jgi:hypothetical protein
MTKGKEILCASPTCYVAELNQNNGKKMTIEAQISTGEDGQPRINTIGMEPPGPFVAIMGWIEANPDATEVIVRLERNPVYLFPELNEINWGWDYLNETPGNIELHLKRLST